jgi:hypothetical protein
MFKNRSAEIKRVLMNLVSGRPGLLLLLVGSAAAAIVFLIVGNTDTAHAEICGNRLCCIHHFC